MDKSWQRFLSDMSIRYCIPKYKRFRVKKSEARFWTG